MSGCFICRRESIPHLVYKGQPLCQICAPNALAGEMMMQFSENEEEAIALGGDDAGEYLDSLSKTDLATLTGDEWMHFLRRFLTGYSAHMRAGAAKHPPF